MNYEFKKWLYESKDTKNIYLLVGPPAVGKSTWLDNNISDDSIIVSKDDIIENVIFPKYKLANKEIFQLPPENSQLGSSIPGKEKLGKVISKKRFSKSKNMEVEEKLYEIAYKAGEELNSLYDKKIDEAISSDKNNIVIDAMHMNKSTRESTLQKFSGVDAKFIAVVFPHQGYEVQIKKSADFRAKDFLERYGPDFDRGVTWQDYEKMYSKYEAPSKSEGFDQIINATSRFSKTDKELGLQKDSTDEELVEFTRNFLQESRLSKYWKRRMEARVKRTHREPKNSIDRQWAEIQQEKSKKLNKKIHRIFEKEMEVTEELSKEIDEFLERVKTKREEEKKRIQEKVKLIPLNKKRPKGTLKPPPTNAEIETKGVAAGYRAKSKKVGGATVAPGESFGPGE